MTRRLIGGGLALAVIVAGLWFFAFRDDGNTKVGQSYLLSYPPGTTADSATVTVSVPFATWTFTVHPPVDEVGVGQLEDYDGEYDDVLKAPNGASFVAVTATYRPAATMFAGAVIEPQPLESASLVLPGGESAQIPIDQQEPGELAPKLLVVPVDAGVTLDEISVSVTAADLTQVVSLTGAQPDDLGKAAPLYEPEVAADVECGHSPSAADGTAAVTTVGCGGTVIRSPYHPDLGWAGDGRTWNWVALDIDASSWQDPLQSSGGFCDDVSLEVSATIGGEVAALDLVNPVGSYSSSWVAFFVIPGAAAEPPGEIEVSTIVSCSPGARRQCADRDVHRHVSPGLVLVSRQRAVCCGDARRTGQFRPRDAARGHRRRGATRIAALVGR